MDQSWRPASELPAGHYALGRLLDGGEAHIYNAGNAMLDVANGHKVIIAGWRPLDVHPFGAPAAKIQP